MELDKLFAKEIKSIVNKTNDREEVRAFYTKLEKVSKEMSTPDIMNTFDEMLKKHGRALVGLCVAVTIDYRRNRLLSEYVTWADEVLKLWKCRSGFVARGVINDGLHPSRIEQYARSLVKATSN